MAFTQRGIVATWLTAVGLLSLTLAATLWKRDAHARRVSLADADDLMRLDSDMG